MQAINIQSNKNEWIIRLDKSKIPMNIFLQLIERFRIEYLAKKASFNEEVLTLAEEIDKK